MSEFRININSNPILPLAGENVFIDNLVYLGVDNKYYRASASVKSKSTTELKIVLKDSLINESVELLEYGYHTFSEAVLVPGAKYYVSIISGEITSEVYSNSAKVIRYVGTATTNRVLLFNPDQTYISDYNSTINSVEIKITDKHYTHIQIASSTVWVAIHGLNKYPSVTIVDSGGNIIYGDVTYNSLNQITITFMAPFSGKAYFN